MRHSLLWCTLLTASLAAAQVQAEFKPRYYPDCYAPLESAREMVPSPPPDLKTTAGTVTRVAGIASSLGGLAGFGGFGGTTLQAAQTINTVNQYSGLIADVAAFTSAMQQEFPDLGLRLSAYGSHLGDDGDLLTQAADRVAAGQQCYRSAYEALAMASVNGELKERDVKRQHEEITKGMEFAQGILGDARGRVTQNVKSYNKALQLETSNAGIDLGGLLSLTGSGGVVDALAGNAVSAAVTGNVSTQALQLADYETLGRMSALNGALVSGGAVPAGINVDAAVLQGLKDAGAMSTRYLQINNTLGTAMLQQDELAAYLGKLPLAK